MKAFLFIIAGLAGWIPQKTLAHSCASLVYEASFYESNFVAYGRVENIRPTKENNVLVGDFNPIEVYKGKFGGSYKVTGSERRIEFGSEILREGEYLIFSTSEKTEHIRECNASRQMEENIKEPLLQYMAEMRTNPPKRLPENRSFTFLNERCRLGGNHDFLVCIGNTADIKETVAKFRERSRKRREKREQLSKEQAIFEDIALTICLAKTVDRPEAQAILNNTAKSHFERSHLSPEALESIHSISAEWLNKNYASKQGSSLESMKCIDMLRSDELGALYEELTPCKSADSWLDALEYTQACN